MGVRAQFPQAQIGAGQPPSSEHDVINCSVAGIELTVLPAGGEPSTTLPSAHGGAYELGMRP